MELTNDPNDPDLKVLHTTKQYKKTLVHHESERTPAKFVNQLRNKFRHLKCHQMSTVATSVAETLARDPKFYKELFCGTCQVYVPITELVWFDKKKVGDRFELQYVGDLDNDQKV